MTNPRQHDSKIVRKPFLPRRIDERLVFAPDVLWIGGFVWGDTGYTVCEL